MASHGPSQNRPTLATPIQYCPGVGPRKAALLEKMGIYTVRDLFWHFPRGYEDHRSITLIADLTPGHPATVIGQVTSVNIRRPRGKVRHVINALIQDQSGVLEVVWFNQPYLANQFSNGSQLRLHGRVDFNRGFLSMKSPKMLSKSPDSQSTGIEPLYPLSEGVRHGDLKKIVNAAFDRFGELIEEILPEHCREELRFPSRKEAFRILHRPQIEDEPPIEEDDEGIAEQGDESQKPIHWAETRWEHARRRLGFEELLLHQLMLFHYRGRVVSLEGVSHIKPAPEPWTAGEVDLADYGAWPARFVQSLPFSLTEDQKKVCQEIERDMQAELPMHRLLQGDVGSGKTVVSVYAMVTAAAGGYQAALMAPTEILAQQHAANIRGWLKAIPEIHVITLTGSAKSAERREALELIKTGAVHLIIGTHALFQEAVHFFNLGLVVVDEQHKFGVEQRERLAGKGKSPDLLVCTATPIPRTLSLTLFGDMDTSVIRSLPPGRPPLVTRWTHWSNEGKIWQFVDEHIEMGEQAYVVCPIIEASENNPHLPSTEEAFENLSQNFLPHRRVVLLHGRHRMEEKEEMMRRMRAGEVDVVVATTVIEVGVDLPNATIMVILGADRFGLAQLHQLRGRVGRGVRKSYCILVTEENISPMGHQRMKVLEKSRDGFYIAEQDLRLRGPGEHLGTRQSGYVRYKLADPVRDVEWLREANNWARKIHEQDPNLQSPDNQPLRHELSAAFPADTLRRPS